MFLADQSHTESSYADRTYVFSVVKNIDDKVPESSAHCLAFSGS